MRGGRRGDVHDAGPSGNDGSHSRALDERGLHGRGRRMLQAMIDGPANGGPAISSLDGARLAKPAGVKSAHTTSADDNEEVRLPRWLVARLCAAVLAAGIAVDGADEFLFSQESRLEGGETTSQTEGKRRVRIFTLGRFSLVKGDIPVSFNGKTPHKPIELLQALIALGGRDVHTELLMGAVWPDDDSADLRSLFDNTLHRLRRILDCTDALVVQDGKLTLNARYCWVDAWDFDRIAGEHGARPAPDHALAALRIYQGHFLQREAPRSWLFAYRERLRRRFHRLVLTEGERLESAGRREDAASFYERGLELDPLAETLYQRLMGCLACTGAMADVLCVYRRCREQLAAELGVEPAPATEAIRRAALGSRPD